MTDRTRKSSPSIPATDAWRIVSSMLGAVEPTPPKSIPMPIMFAVSSSGSGAASGRSTRLNPMSEPPAELLEHLPHVLRPLFVRVLLLHPWQRLGQLLARRRQREAVAEIRTPVAE